LAAAHSSSENAATTRNRVGAIRERCFAVFVPLCGIHLIDWMMRLDLHPGVSLRLPSVRARIVWRYVIRADIRRASIGASG